MAENLSNSLKGKIWLSTTALAIFISTFGVISYLIISYLVNDSFFAVFIPFILLAVSVVAFGWWLANEITQPIEKVLLLGKSLERGISTSVPKTSGASETDEIMESLSRISQQVHKLVNSMDEVAQGNLDVMLIPTAGSDRISTTFQKLLSKVSESIHAQQNLERLLAAVKILTEEAAPIRDNNLYVAIGPGSKQTKDLSMTLNHLIDQLTNVISQVKFSAQQSHNLSLEVQKTLHDTVSHSENRIQEMNEATVMLKHVPNMVQKISQELSQSASSAEQTVQKAKKGTTTAHANLSSINKLKKKVQESIKQIQKLNESSQEIGRVAKTVEDLAHRTNMIALNASIQAAEFGEEGRSFILISEEIEHLAERAGNTNKNISSLNKSIQSEIGKVENTLETAVGEIGELSKFAIEVGNSIGEMERYMTQYLNLQEKIVVYTNEQTEDTEKAFQTFVESIAESEKSLINLKDSEKIVGEIKNTMDNLQTSVAHFTSSPYADKGKIKESSFAEVSETTEQNTSV